MNTKLLATVFRWIGRSMGLVLVGLTLLIAIGEGMPNPFTQPFVIQIGFLALAMVLLGILLAWRWELPGAILSLAGWILFVMAVRINWHKSIFLILLCVPSLLFLGSFFLRWYHDKHKSA